jgi:hypothetical protein
MPTNDLYHTWFRRVRQLHPGKRITQIRNLTWLILGIQKSRSVFLSQIGLRIPGQAKLLSTVRRLSRFLDNPAIRVREWYEPVASRLIAFQIATLGEVRLIVDGTKVGAQHQLLIVALAYRKRSLPLVWTWIRSVKGHSSTIKQLALLTYLWGLIPTDVPVLLVGDSEFGGIEILRQLDAWKWRYVLRQKPVFRVRTSESEPWQHARERITRPGESFWFEGGWLTAKHAYRVNLLLHWKPGEEEPWVLASNLTSRRKTLQAYERRMWIEEMFGDFKAHGFDLERTQLRHFLRLSRLTLAVAFLYTWIVAFGARVIKNGLRHMVDRKERRDLSIFQIGLRSIERRLINDRSISVHLVPPLEHKLSGG